jgi:hypothetical protein
MSACADRLLRLGLLLLMAGCADHTLDLSIALATDSCDIPVPAGGSVLYQVTGGAPADGGASTSFCGGCLPVTAALADANGILDFLRATAPSCQGIKPNTSLRVTLTAYSSPGCNDPTARVFCSASPPVTLPDGHADAVVSVTLTCDPGCGGGPCRPTTCAALGKNCGPVSDGCNGTLQCGMCMKPQECGGHMASGVPGVCSK